METYEQLIAICGSPSKAAYMLGFWNDKSTNKRKRDATARVCNWKVNGLPKRDKLLLKKFKSLLP